MQPQYLQDFLGQHALDIVKRRAKAAIQVPIARQHPVAEQGAGKRSCHRGDDTNHIHSRFAPGLQPVKQRYGAGGFITVQQCHEGPGSIGVLAVKEQAGGATQLSQEFFDVVTNICCQRITDKPESPHSGHSEIGALSALWLMYASSIVCRASRRFEPASNWCNISICHEAPVRRAARRRSITAR